MLREAGREISVTGYLDYRRYLANLYNWVKKRAESYSYITFSIQLGLGKSNASRLIVIGQRNLAEKSAGKVAESIGLRGYRARYFEQIVAYANAKTTQDRDEAYARLMVIKSRVEPETLDQEKIDFFANWLTAVIKDMALLPGFIGDPQWIQEHLNFPLRLEEVKKALTVLHDLGFLAYDGKRKLYRAAPQPPEPLQPDALAAIAYHQQMIEAGKESLTRLPGKKREVSGCTARMSAAKFARIQAKLQAIVDEAAADDNEPDQEVYQVNVQLFPFTKIGQK
jgi:uncharacterized protein (TIGR02147 family)